MTDRETTLQDALRGLAWLADHVDDLWAAIEGQKPRWRDGASSDRSGPGSPWNMRALGVHIDLLTRSHILHESIAQTVGHPRLDPPASTFDSPSPFLAYCLELLSEATLTTSEALGWCRWVDPMRLQVAVLLGEVVEGQVLDAMCPFCLGFGPSSPAGGAKTLVFRRVPRMAGLRPVTTGEDDGTEIVIMCESGTCSPFASECSGYSHGRPYWPWPEWEWLAARLLRGA